MAYLSILLFNALFGLLHSDMSAIGLKQDKFVKFISPMNGYFRETCKSQNINPIYLDP